MSRILFNYNRGGNTIFEKKPTPPDTHIQHYVETILYPDHMEILYNHHHDP